MHLWRWRWRASQRVLRTLAVTLCALALVPGALVLSGVLEPPAAEAAVTCPTTTQNGFTATPSTAPLASCLIAIGDDTDVGQSPPDAGVAVSVSNLSTLGGLATDGTTVYMLNQSTGDIVTTPLSALPTPSATSGTTASATGTVHTVDWSGIGGFGIALDHTLKLSLAYSHGCLFVTNSDDSESSSQNQNTTPLEDTDTSAIFSTNIDLYCIDTSTWTASAVTIPSSCPMPIGHYYTTSSLIDFPDGRIGKVSEYMSNNGEYVSSSEGGYTSVLRTYTVSGTGSSATIACSTDYVMHDTEDFGNDEHGIATDGTYLYRIEWHQAESPYYDHNFNSWELSSSSVPNPTYQGFYAMPFSNMHYLAYNSTDHDYLVGYYDNSDFYITPEADPGPGPGNPLTPAFSSTVTGSDDGYSVQLTNYDSTFTWTGSATNGGTVSISSSGLVTVSGLARGQSSTVTIDTTKTGIASGSGSDSSSALAATVPGAPTDVQAGAGDGQATVSWSAPDDGGATIEHYTVTATDTTDPVRGGETVTTPDGIRDVATVTGLTDDDTYTFAVSATSSVGTGPASTASASVTPRKSISTTSTTSTTTTTTTAPTTAPPAATSLPGPPAETAPPVVVPRATTFVAPPQAPALPVKLACEHAACAGVANLTVARRRADGSYRHLVLAKGDFSLAEGQVAEVELRRTALGAVVLPAQMPFWLERQAHFRMTLTVRSASGVTHTPVYYRP